MPPNLRKRIIRPALISKGVPARRDVLAAASFRVGQRVRARNISPVGHTRLPRSDWGANTSAVLIRL